MANNLSAPPSNSLVQKISLWEKIAYGGGDLACNFILVITSTYVTFFYTDALGLNAGIIGSIVFFSKFADGITDILMGFVVDKTRSKHGKARPWILWMSVPICIVTVLVFLVPNIGEAGKYVYVAVTYNLVSTVLYTAINVPYGTLSSLLSRDQNQRMVINAFRMSMAQIGSLIINSVTLPLVNALGGSVHQRSWVIAAIIYAAIACVLFNLCFVSTKERVKVASQQNEKLGFKKGIGLIFHNKYWLLLVAIWVCYGLSYASGAIVTTYYSKYILSDENLAGIINGMCILPVVILIPFLSPIVKKIGKRNVALIGSLIGIVGQALLVVSPYSAGWVILCHLLKGIGYGTLLGTFFAMIADTVEYGQWHTGTRVEGMLYSCSTFGAKITAGLAVSLVLGFISNAGYDGLAAIQPESALVAIKNIFLFAPLPFAMLMPILFFAYKLDKIFPKVMSDLQERENQQ